MRCLALALFVAVSCNPPDIITSHGINITNNTSEELSPWRIELLVDLLIEELGKGRKILGGSDVYIESELTLPGTGRPVNGYAEVMPKDAFVRYTSDEFPCFAATAFQHELTHIIQFQLERSSDLAHTDIRYWGPQKKAKHRAQMLSCPPEDWDSIPEDLKQQGPWL